MIIEDLTIKTTPYNETNVYTKLNANFLPNLILVQEEEISINF